MNELEDNKSLLRLPPELIIYILKFLQVESLIQITKTCKSLRLVCSTSETVWKHPLLEAVLNSQVHVNTQITTSNINSLDLEINYHALVNSGRYSLIPSRTWISLLPIMSRNFLLYYMELPYLKDIEWREVCYERFTPSTIDSELERRQLLSPELVRFGKEYSWRRFFLTELDRLEHRLIHGCTHNEHLCQYLVLNRNKKYGLTMNRMATRTFDPVVTYEAYKLQNGLSEHDTVSISIPRHLSPPDLKISFLVTIGKESSFLRNEVTMDLLESMGCWKRGNNQSILGPALITAAIRASLDLPIATLHHPDTFVTLKPQDLTRKILTLTRDCEIGLGSGY